MPVPYTFGSATASIPLSQLDSNFATAITIGNTAVQLGNTVTTLNNMTLANVTISSGNVTITNVSVTTANVSGTANVQTLAVTQNATVAGNVTVTGNVSMNVGTITTANATTANVGSLIVTGNQTFVGTGNRITGDFSNATVTNRVIFQSSTTNGSTGVTAIPNGTNNVAGFLALPYSAIIGNASSYGQFSCSTSEVKIDAGILSGGGSYLPMTFYTGGSERMRVDTSGNVGIGQTSQVWDEKLGVRLATSGSGTVGLSVYSGSTTYTSSMIRVQAETGGSGWKMYEGRANGGSQLFWVDGSGGAYFAGNVGIGTSSPSAKLDVANGTIQVTSGYGVFSGAGGANASGFNFGTNLVQAYTSNTERMRIDSSGRLLINTNTTGSYFDGPLCAYNASSLVASFKTDSAAAYPLACYSTATSGNNLFITFLTEGTPTTRGYIDYNRAGTAVRYNTSSDERLKKNIVDAGSAIPLINSIKIRSFDWKETDSHVDFGVIAQELNTVAPDAVSEGTTGDDMTKTWGVDTSTLVPALVKAIQEQQALIQQLQADIATLKGQK